LSISLVHIPMSSWTTGQSTERFKISTLNCIIMLISSIYRFLSINSALAMNSESLLKKFTRCSRNFVRYTPRVLKIVPIVCWSSISWITSRSISLKVGGTSAGVITGRKQSRTIAECYINGNYIYLYTQIKNTYTYETKCLWL
jgi:hypothetical protein